MKKLLILSLFLLSMIGLMAQVPHLAIFDLQTEFGRYHETVGFKVCSVAPEAFGGEEMWYGTGSFMYWNWPGGEGGENSASTIYLDGIDPDYPGRILIQMAPITAWGQEWGPGNVITANFYFIDADDNETGPYELTKSTGDYTYYPEVISWGGPDNTPQFWATLESPIDNSYDLSTNTRFEWSYPTEDSVDGFELWLNDTLIYDGQNLYYDTIDELAYTNFYTWSVKPYNLMDDTKVYPVIEEQPYNTFTTAWGVNHGSGTEEDPYLVDNISTLIFISNNQNYWDKHFLQTANIDASSTSELNDEAGFSPIGNNSNYFTGSYDGQGYTISNLYINRPITSYIGLFGRTQSAKISNLGIVDADIVGGSYVGGLVGHSSSSTISNSYTTGTVNGSSSVGGLLGRIPSDSSYRSYIINSYATADVSGSSNYIGGLVGYYYTGSYIRNSYSTGAVSGGGNIGGLVGYSNNATITNSFWDTETSGQTYSAGGTGKTTEQMLDIDTYLTADWDFEAFWLINNGINSGYPVFFNNYIQNISILNNSTNQLLTPTISCDILSDFIYYEIKFGTEENPQDQLVEFSPINGIISYTFPESLEYYTDYYWTLVLANENFELTTLEFSFRTRPEFEGLGTEDSPYEIGNLNHLLTISEYETLWDKHFIQIANIDASSTSELNEGAGFSPIGVSFSQYFSGKYNGQGYNISNIYINRPNTNFVGVFGFISNADISNLGIVDAEIIGSSYVGGLIGFCYNSSIISNCYASGSVRGAQKIGGLVGKSYDYLTISNSYSTGTVSGDDEVGGLVGYSDSSSSTSHLTIRKSYATGAVSGNSAIGGLVGRRYGNDSSFVTNSYWNIETSGTTSSAGGTGKTTEEMQNIYTYLDTEWDFLPENANGEENIWYIHPNYNSGYPFFANEHLSLPLHAINLYPHHELENLPTSDNLLWDDDYLEFATGYRINLGTDNPPTDVINNQELGFITSYDFINFQPNTTYYWQVIPYNEAGDAEDCPIWSFTTGTQDVISIGSGANTPDQLPINYQFKKSYSQSIYLQSELAMNRDIEKLAFYITEESYFEGANQWKVYLGHTDKTEFSTNNDWLLSSQGLVQVADITLNDTIQTGWIEIELDTPFAYNNSDNLILGVIEYNAETSETLNNHFYTSEMEDNRTITFAHDTISPNTNIPFIGELTNSVPKVSFTFSEAITTFSGIVKNFSNSPIANANFIIENVINTLTDENGAFDMQDIVPATYEITVSAPWYETQTIEYEVIEGQDNYLEITLLEELLPANNVVATLAEDLSNVNITWSAPVLSREADISKQIKGIASKAIENLVQKQELEQRTGQPDLLYNLYRYGAGDEETPENWVQVITNLDALTYTDVSFPSLELGNYYWAVEAVYANNRLANPTISNEILKQPYLESNIDDQIDFGVVYLTNESGYSEIVLTNSGTGALTLSAISCEETAFYLLYDQADFVVETNASVTIQVNFIPDSPGVYMEDLFITNNSTNEPNYTISLRGVCEYLPPAPPENVQVTMAGHNANITWEAVTEDISHNSLTPDFYAVYYNGLNNETEELFFYHGTTTGLSYTHPNVGAFSEIMFYRVKAYVDVDNIILSMINELVSQKHKVSQTEIESMVKEYKTRDWIKK